MLQGIVCGSAAYFDMPFVHHALPAQHMRQFDAVRAFYRLRFPYRFYTCPLSHHPASFLIVNHFASPAKFTTKVVLHYHYTSINVNYYCGIIRISCGGEGVFFCLFQKNSLKQEKEHAYPSSIYQDFQESHSRQSANWKTGKAPLLNIQCASWPQHYIFHYPN